MSEIFVFSQDEEDNDYSTMGLVGALTPTSCIFTEELNGESSIELTHPLDPLGRYRALQRGNILVISVPVRTTPEIRNGEAVRTVWIYQVRPLAQLSSKNQRTLYKKETGSGKMKLMNPGDVITVVQKSETEGQRWKAKTPYGTGWVNPDGILFVREETDTDAGTGGVSRSSMWRMTSQYWRIYEVTWTLTEVKVHARHISYDLLYNLTDFESSSGISLGDALDGLLSACYAKHPFSAYTNIADERSGLSFSGKNPIDALLDPEQGLCALYNATLVRDNYDLYLLKQTGASGGMHIEYGKNLQGITFSSSEDDVITRILPIGEKKNGDPLYLSDSRSGRCVDSPYIDAYPVPHIAELKCENCKVGETDEGGGKVTEAVARARMLAQANEKFSEHCDEPGISLSVTFVNLGDTEEYAQYRNLELVFLGDYVTIVHPGIVYRETDGTIRPMEMLRQVVKLQWDCLTDRMRSMEVGDMNDGLLSRVTIASWQLPKGIDGAKLIAGSINSMQLADEAVAGQKLQDDSIGAGNISEGSIETSRLADDAVTMEKLSPEIRALLVNNT